MILAMPFLRLSDLPLACADETCQAGRDPLPAIL